MSVHICGGRGKWTEWQEPFWPHGIIQYWGKLRHKLVRRRAYIEEWYDPIQTTETACGKSGTAYPCTLRRKPCPKCYPESA